MNSQRINLGELKIQITKRVGSDRAHRYFSYLQRWVSQKLSKPEFNKLCLLTLGRENLPLHNQLIKAVYKNAFHAKTPPPLFVNKKETLKIQSNGDVLLPPTAKRGTPSGNRRSKDNGKVDIGISNHILAPYCEDSAIQDNGDLGLCDMVSPLKTPIQAPLGIPFCRPSIGGAQRDLPSTVSAGIGNFSTGSFETGELCNTEELRRRMEIIAEGQGLGAVSMDCANLLNTGLDVYLKQMIKSCFELVGTRSGHGQMKQQVDKQQGKPINDLDGLISLQDFRVAMELNPQQLGENWPLILEKICLRSFGE